MRPDERQTLEAVVDAVLAKGYRLRVWDGGDEPAVNVTGDRKTAIEGCDGVGEATLVIVRPGDRSIFGEIFLVFGNEPGVLISDHTDVPELTALLAPIAELCDRVAATTHDWRT